MLLTRKQLAEALDLSESYVGALIRRLGIAPVGRGPAVGKQGMRPKVYPEGTLERLRAAGEGKG